MQTRKMGATELDLPVITMGGLPKDPEARDRMASVCLDLGINHFDTADAQAGGEEGLGEALKGRRHEAIINTSFDLRPGNSRSNADQALRSSQTPRERIFSSLEASLTKLGTDYVDLYHIHHREPGVPAEAILEPLNDLVKEGKIRYIGESTYSGWRHAQTNAVAQQNGWAEMDYMQTYYSVMRRHVELEALPYCTENNVSMMVYHPLAYGFLTGNFGRGTPPLPEFTGKNPNRNLEYYKQDDRSQDILEELTTYANERGYSIPQLAYAWLLAHPAVTTVITGAANPDELTHNAKAADWELTPEERDEIDAIGMWDGTSEEIEEPGDFRREYYDGKFGLGFVTLEGRQEPQR